MLTLPRNTRVNTRFLVGYGLLILCGNCKIFILLILQTYCLKTIYKSCTYRHCDTHSLSINDLASTLRVTIPIARNPLNIFVFDFKKNILDNVYMTQLDTPLVPSSYSVNDFFQSIKICFCESKHHSINLIK